MTKKPLIGSMFSGLLGGLDIACERVFGAETAWQLDITGADVRRRHWPGVLQVEADVATVNPADLPRVDVLCGGFPCQDLSTAGKQAGLDGARSGLYRHVLRFARVLGPQYVVLENVSGLLPYMPRLVADFQALGYGLSYAVCEAADVGLPHLRRRVFVVGELGAAGRGRVEVDRSRRWSAVESEREWVTPTERDHRSAGGLTHTRGGACLNDQAAQVREWPSPMMADGLRGSATMMRGNPTLPGAVREWPTPMVRADQLQPGVLGWEAASVREWPTAVGADADDVKSHGGNGNPSLNFEARQRLWATVTTRDYKSGDLPHRVGTEALSAQAGAALLGQHGKRLNPTWVECLMGVPQDWTLPDGPSLRDQLDTWRAPRGRYPANWDRSVPWPGFAWEPPRTLPDGPPCPGRPARIRGLGNGVVWQQAEIGIGACLDGPITTWLPSWSAWWSG